MKTIKLNSEIKEMLATETETDPEEIRAAEYIPPESKDSEHFLVSVEFFSRPPVWLEVLTDSELAHLVL